MRFILTSELGKLARWLRILGFDAVYQKSDKLYTLIIQALRDNRTIITRRKDKMGDLEKNILVINSNKLKEQLQEIKTGVNLKIEESRMFTRCAICNELLFEAKKEEIRTLAPEYVYKTQDLFMQCPSCKKIYWQGSHWGNIKGTLRELNII
jgi:uncharacterized protein with PIN domain